MVRRGSRALGQVGKGPAEAGEFFVEVGAGGRGVGKAVGLGHLFELFQGARGGPGAKMRGLAL